MANMILTVLYILCLVGLIANVIAVCGLTWIMYVDHKRENDCTNTEYPRRRL